MKKVMFLICALLLFSLTACKTEEKVSIRGAITNVTLSDDEKTGSILVEGEIEEDTSYDKARVRVSEKTKIYKGESKEKLEIDALKEGTKVEIMFTGPVRESYPVQADAEIIRIIE